MQYSEERYAYEVARIPKRIIVESEEDPLVFWQLYPCYYNTATRVIALKRPWQDPDAPGATKRKQALTSVEEPCMILQKSSTCLQKSYPKTLRYPTLTYSTLELNMPPKGPRITGRE